MEPVAVPDEDDWGDLAGAFPAELGAAVMRLFDAAGLRPLIVDHVRRLPASARNTVVGLTLQRHGRRAAGRLSLVVKAATEPDAGSVRRVNHEVDAMRFVRRLPDPEVSALAPAIYAHDAERGIAIMEDVAIGRDAVCLEDLLCGPSSDAAVSALLALGRTLGRLHRLTWSRDAGGDGHGAGPRSAVIPDPDTAAAVLQAALARIGLTVTAESVRELRAIDRLLAGAGGHAFCHADISPSNVLVSRAGIHLCDFEASGDQHPMLEGTHLGCLFPLAVAAGAVPESVRQRVVAAYREELDLARTIDAADLARLEAATLLAFILYHWAYTHPMVGVPIGHGGARAKVLDLMRRLDDGSLESVFPAVTRHLRLLAQAMRNEGALGPDESQLYACFDRGNVVSGIFRVNSACHVVIKPRGPDALVIYVLEFPQISCHARRCGRDRFRCVEMPLELDVSGYPNIAVRDTRTQKVTTLVEQAVAVMWDRFADRLGEIERRDACEMALT